MDVNLSRKPVCRSFWRLALLIKLLIRVCTPKLVLVQQEPHFNVKKPTILELSAENNKKKITERIHQRLLHKPQVDPSPNSGHTAAAAAAAIMPSILSNEVQNFLISPPWVRSTELLEKACVELQACPSFHDFPVAVQKSICKLGWYQSVEPNRIIYTAGYDPACYYLLLSGTVTEVAGKVQYFAGNVINTYHEGSSFGDAAIIDETSRMSSCYAKDHIELLVISRSDYIDLSLRQCRKSYQNNKHFAFCRTVSLLKQWPLNELSSDNCIQYYYKAGTVIVKDSKKSDWIYVVMSGSCHVVKRFIDNSSLHGKPGHQKSLSNDTAAMTGSPLLTQFHPHNRRTDDEKSADSSENHHQKLRDRRATYPHFQEENDSDRPKGRPILVQLQILHPKDIFGMSSLLYEDEPSISLVSNGSECVLISRSYIITHIGDRCRTWLYKQVQQFPSQEVMLKRIREHHSWNIYKQTLVSHLRKKHS